ncbi:hypothetical protein O181_063877 [Austropuccinia psidii MF-1]|uniref:Uncharacterized protein n=1 Tax=Austropuccinia psidii MF-1 TaxID=1389203 RepID=A0A9Q3EUQ1_9BASI|nr:hypothetical protein [Austropuccinia psidii MF-1]
MHKGKEKREMELLITEKKWTPIAPHRARKPQNSSSIQGKPTLITYTVDLTVIKPDVASQVRFPKALEHKFVQIKVKAKHPSNKKLFTNCRH